MKTLVIFDIDGTLTKTKQVDDQCFVQAFADEFGLTEFDTNWEQYPTVCDSGITCHIFQSHFRRDPAPIEVARIQQRFLSLLQTAYARDPQLFAPMPGAAAILQQLQQLPHWAIAIATGGWRCSAYYKLQKAGIMIDSIPAAFADDAYERREILLTAFARAREHYTQDRFTRVVYVGDGVWDVHTAQALGLAFVGIASGERQAALHAAGATAIMQDFTDAAQFVQMVEEGTYG